MKLFEKAGFPPRVINFVTGRGEIIGNRLASHTDVDKLTFTGETNTARKLMNPASPKGYFIKPTVFVDVDPSMLIAQEEIFGTVVPVIPFSHEDEAIEITNSVSYGLTSGVWTKDMTRAFRMAKNMRLVLFG